MDNMLEVYTTAKDTQLRLSREDDIACGPGADEAESAVCVFVDPTRRHQQLLGIGGAITDASAEVFAGLADHAKQSLIEAYYDASAGIGYSLLRTTIHSSDFSSHSYTYIDEGDAALESFSVDHDQAHRIPLIRRALSTATNDIKVYASPWSAPAFMKDNGSMLQGGRLLPQYASAWAQYYAKFIEAYRKADIPIWGITLQNEPMAKQTWESMIYTAEEERDFLKAHLGPTLQAAGMEDIRIIVWDHNRDLLNHRARVILDDPDAARFVWGIGFHWYETWAGGEPMYRNVAQVHEDYPDIYLLLTEATVENFDAARYQHWPNGERYGDAMINDFNAGAVGWTDWNILLDDNGGPNHVGNYCMAPIHADTETGELIFTPSYYYIGHFSKFMRPGATRVSATTNRSQLQTTAFINLDGSLVIIVMNTRDEPIDYQLFLGDTRASGCISARAIQTLVHR